MKNYVIKSVLVVFLLSLAALSQAQQQFDKTYNKDFTVNATSRLTIQNKYGDVHVENGATDKVKIDVKITVDADDQKEADEIMKKISIEFSSDSNNVKAITKIDGRIKGKFSIDYNVVMPANITFDLSNHFGDVYINEANGLVNIVVQYGSFKANRMLNSETKPRSMLSLAYSDNSSIGTCNWLKLDLSYSELSITKSNALIMVSKYSEFSVDESQSIVCESKYDQPFHIGSVSNFVCTGQYSDYSIDNISKMGELNLKYSDLKINNVAENFDNLKIDLQFGNADIDVAPSANYTIDAEAEFSEISHPTMSKINQVTDHMTQKITGTVGSKDAPASKIQISSKYGEVQIQ